MSDEQTLQHISQDLSDFEMRVAVVSAKEFDPEEFLEPGEKIIKPGEPCPIREWTAAEICSLDPCVYHFPGLSNSPLIMWYDSDGSKKRKVLLEAMSCSVFSRQQLLEFVRSRNVVIYKIIERTDEGHYLIRYFEISATSQEEYIAIKTTLSASSKIRGSLKSLGVSDTVVSDLEESILNLLP
jgi:hypothetical protein